MTCRKTQVYCISVTSFKYFKSRQYFEMAAVLDSLSDRLVHLDSEVALALPVDNTDTGDIVEYVQYDLNGNVMAQTEETSNTVNRFNANSQFTDPKEFIDSFKNKNTKRKTNVDVNLFKKFAEGRGYRDIDALSMDEDKLDTVISTFFLSVRKSNGENYEPDSLLSMFNSLTRYFKDNGINLKSGDKFNTARGSLNARRKQLKEMGLGNKKKKADPFTSAEIDILWAKGELGYGEYDCLISLF